MVETVRSHARLANALPLIHTPCFFHTFMIEIWAQGGLELNNSPASANQIAEIVSCTTKLGFEGVSYLKFPVSYPDGHGVENNSAASLSS